MTRIASALQSCGLLRRSKLSTLLCRINFKVSPMPRASDQLACTPGTIHPPITLLSSSSFSGRYSQARTLSSSTHRFKMIALSRHPLSTTVMNRLKSLLMCPMRFQLSQTLASRLLKTLIVLVFSGLLARAEISSKKRQLCSMVS